MVKSMTGYGIAQFENDFFSISVEIKALNSKFLDIATKLPKEISPFENDLRKIISEKLVRGKISFTVDVTLKSGVSNVSQINKDNYQQYLSQIRSVTSDLNLTDADIFSGIMRMPDLFEKAEEQLTELVDKEVILKLTQEAVQQCDAFRVKEGKSIHIAMTSFGQNISSKLARIKEIDPERIKNIKSRINDNLTELSSSEKADPNRFEQELIYYIEKLDITEEFVRLQNHLDFFEETLAEKESQGKKLGFISQEMGREINTIGSKANDSDIQKLVVVMKDELEKIKEQVLNVV